MSFSFAALMKSLVGLVGDMGYPGIFLFMLIGSTFIPIPEELTLVAAGYLVFQGTMNGPLLFLTCIAGSLAGATVNYWIARHYGRRLFIRYGRYLMMTPEKLAKMENYFVEHGAISIFTGRILPGAKHYISFPAGLACMALKPFYGYLLLGGALWICIVLTLGYEIGSNEAMLTLYMGRLKIVLVVFAAVIVGLYVFIHWRRKQVRS